MFWSLIIKILILPNNMAHHQTLHGLLYYRYCQSVMQGKKGNNHQSHFGAAKLVCLATCYYTCV
ncbi:hypothetical protein ACB098_08G142700 [Castanea mollissima]